MIEHVIDGLIKAIEHAEGRAGHPCRKQIVSNLECLISSAHKSTLRAVLSRATLSLDQISEINFQAHCAYVSVVALLKLASEPNTQWDHGEIWIEQLKYHIRQIRHTERGAENFDPESFDAPQG